MLHYLPGCDVRKNHPQAIDKLEKYMLQKGAVIDKCCRTKKKLLEENDIMVTNCTMCYLVMEETHYQNRNISLYEYILKDKDFTWVDHHGEIITLQDCWRTRNNKNLQDAIRNCLKKMNFKIVETTPNRQNTQYDGIWKNNKIDDILLDVAPQTFQHILLHDIQLVSLERQEKMMKEWGKQYQTDKVAVYCNACEKGLKMGGIEPIHLVELIAEGL